MKSRPYELCYLFKLAWESHKSKQGMEYSPTGRDLREAKEFLAMNEIPDGKVFEKYLNNFLNSNYEGWVHLNHPAWALFKHWNTFAPKPEKKPLPKLIYCEKCNATHYPPICINVQENV